MDLSGYMAGTFRPSPPQNCPLHQHIRYDNNTQKYQGMNHEGDILVTTTIGEHEKGIEYHGK